MNNGNCGPDPKWNSFTDKHIRNILFSLGSEISKLNLSDRERKEASIATAIALTYAGCSIFLSNAQDNEEVQPAADAYLEATKTISSFFEELMSEEKE